MASKYYSDVRPNRADKNGTKEASKPSGKTHPKGDPEFKQHETHKKGGPKA